MRYAEYCTMRRAVQSNAPAPDHAAMVAIETELRVALLATGLFHTVEVGLTDDADRFVIAMCEFAPDVDPAVAGEALARLWSKQVAYGFWRAQTLRVDKGHVELQGATRASLSGHYVTTHLVAREAPVPVRTEPVPARTEPVPARVRQIPSTGILPPDLPASTPSRPRRRLLGGRRTTAA